MCIQGEIQDLERGAAPKRRDSLSSETENAFPASRARAWNVQTDLFGEVVARLQCACCRGHARILGVSHTKAGTPYRQKSFLNYWVARQRLNPARDSGPLHGIICDQRQCLELVREIPPQCQGSGKILVLSKRKRLTSVYSLGDRGLTGPAIRTIPEASHYIARSIAQPRCGALARITSRQDDWCGSGWQSRRHGAR